ncbi:MAG: protein-S-isoprenylcysteine O-methyltransferase [Chloroflexi bacterium]|nr:protein-S-isoprenylcysteine O-methyltransferase [Chloroflexota bacterium]
MDLLAFAGLEIMPVVYVLVSYEFPAWLSFANLQWSRWVQWLGVLILMAGLALLWRAHQDLGSQWSATLAIQLEHTLVRRGVYRYVRHPIYAALWLTAFAQFCLLPNWLAGGAGIVCFLPLYLVRVPQEEQSLLAHFGEVYRTYMQQTGRVLPRLGR